MSCALASGDRPSVIGDVGCRGCGSWSGGVERLFDDAGALRARQRHRLAAERCGGRGSGRTRRGIRRRAVDVTRACSDPRRVLPSEPDAKRLTAHSGTSMRRLHGGPRRWSGQKGELGRLPRGEAAGDLGDIGEAVALQDARRDRGSISSRAIHEQRSTAR